MPSPPGPNPNPNPEPNPGSIPGSEPIDALMADLAAGRGHRLFDLVEVAQHPLERLVRGTLARFGRRDLAADQGEVDFLVMTAALIIMDRSGGWRPGGSPPWVWARRAIRSSIAAHVGHATTGSDPAELGPDDGGEAWRAQLRPPVHRCDDSDSLRDVVERDVRYRLLVDALALVAGPRDRAVVLEFIDQKSAGDPSPSHTVAELFGLSPVNVRKIHSRVRGRLLALIDNDDRFAPLARGIWLVGPNAGGDQGPSVRDVAA